MSIECKFPSETDIKELPRVWLTGNEFPWNPNIFEDKESTRVPTCWDGVSELQMLNTMTFQPVDTSTEIGSVNMEYKYFLANTLNYLRNSDIAYSTDPRNEESKVIFGADTY